MRSRKPKVVIAPKCDWCGEHSETFVVTAKHMTFCRVQTVGQPPEKDCMEDYIRSKNVRTKQIQEESKDQRRIQSISKEQLQEKQEKEKEVRLKNIAKLEAYKKEIKLKQWQKRKENHL
jgi:hypothetical protein